MSFGTVTDWYSTIVREGERLGCNKRLTVDWARFATAWRSGYEPANGSRAARRIALDDNRPRSTE